VSEIAAQQQFPLLRQSLAIEKIGADFVKPPAEELVDFQLAVGELGPTPSKRVWTWSSGRAITRVAILVERWSS
jgi:hypothetical protein